MAKNILVWDISNITRCAKILVCCQWAFELRGFRFSEEINDSGVNTQRPWLAHLYNSTFFIERKYS